MPANKIAVIGLGSKSLDQVSLHGLKALKQADLIYFDTDATENLLDFAPSLSELIELKPEFWKTTQAMIDEMESLRTAWKDGLRIAFVVYDLSGSAQRQALLLQALRGAEIEFEVFPSIRRMVHAVAELWLPWLGDDWNARYHVIQSTSIKGSPSFWQNLAFAKDPILVDPGSKSFHLFIEKLIAAGAYPQRPMALIDDLPGRAPTCWLTTLFESRDVDFDWQATGSTLLCIGPEFTAFRSSQMN